MQFPLISLILWVTSILYNPLSIINVSFYGILNNLVSTSDKTESVNLLDSEKGTFNTSTEGWFAYGNNTIENKDGALKITFVDNSSGAVVLLTGASDLNTDLEDNRTYKLRARVKTGSGDNVNIRVYNKTKYPVTSSLINNTDYQWVEIIFNSSKGKFEPRLQLSNLHTTEVFWMDEWTLEELIDEYLHNESNIPNFLNEFNILKGDDTHELRTLFIGNSLHKYGPFFSDTVKAAYSDGGAGIVEFRNNPYSASSLIGDQVLYWKHYDQDTNYWGFHGSAIVTYSDTARIRISRVSTPVNTARLWFEGSENTMKYWFSGDSTQISLTGTGLTYYDIPWAGDETYLYLGAVDDTATLYAIELITGSGYVGDHFGNGGVTAREVSENMEYLKEFASIRQHKLIVIMLGANDLLKSTNVSTLIEYINTIRLEFSSALNNPEFILLTQNYALNGAGGEDDQDYIDKVNKYLASLLATPGIAVYDMGRRFGLFSEALASGYANNGSNIIHPNVEGYKFEGTMLFMEIDNH